MFPFLICIWKNQCKYYIPKFNLWRIKATFLLPENVDARRVCCNIYTPLRVMLHYMKASSNWNIFKRDNKTAVYYTDVLDCNVPI